MATYTETWLYPVTFSQSGVPITTLTYTAYKSGSAGSIETDTYAIVNTFSGVPNTATVTVPITIASGGGYGGATATPTSSSSSSTVRPTSSIIPSTSLATSSSPTSNVAATSSAASSSTSGLLSASSSSSILPIRTSTSAASSSTLSTIIVPTTSSTSALATTSPSSTAAAAHLHSNNALSGGAIAGIVVGSVAGVAILAGLAFLLLRQSRQKRRPSVKQDANGLTYEKNGTVVHEAQGRYRPGEIGGRPYDEMGT